MKYYINKCKCIVFISNKADQDFWDSHWNSNNVIEKTKFTNTDNLFIPTIKKYLNPGALNTA